MCRALFIAPHLLISIHHFFNGRVARVLLDQQEHFIPDTASHTPQGALLVPYQDTARHQLPTSQQVFFFFSIEFSPLSPTLLLYLLLIIIIIIMILVPKPFHQLRIQHGLGVRQIGRGQVRIPRRFRPILAQGIGIGGFVRPVRGPLFGRVHDVVKVAAVIFESATGTFTDRLRDGPGMEHEIFHAYNETWKVGLGIVIVEIVVKVYETGVLLRKGRVFDRDRVVRGVCGRQVGTPVVGVIPLDTIGMAAHLRWVRML